MFFATPHRGGNSKLVGLGKFITTIVRHGSSGSGKNTLLKALEKNGYHNEELRKDWKEQLGYYAFVSFHEDRPTVVFGKDVGQVSRMPIRCCHNHIANLVGFKDCRPRVCVI